MHYENNCKENLKFCDKRVSRSLHNSIRKTRKNPRSVAGGMKSSLQELFGVKVELTRSSKTPA